MNKTRLIALVLAVAASGGALVLMKGLMAQKTPQTQVVVKDTVQKANVLVVVKDIERGMKLAPEDFDWRPWPKKMVTENMLTKDSNPDAIEKYSGKRTLARLYAGEPFFPKKALVAAKGGILAATLPKGMRAISVGISVTTAAGGFIKTDDRVDVLLTRKVGNRTLTDVVLSNVRVLAIDQNNKNDDQAASSDIRTATLELEPRQAEILAKAESMGQLSLALRSLADLGDTKLGDAGPRLSPKFAKTNGGEVRILRYGVPKIQVSN